MGGGTLGNGGPGRGGRIITEINVTPLVDIMLVLLIIFMVTTTTMLFDSIDIKLPEAATGETGKPTLLSIVVRTNGDTYLDGKRITLPALRERIRTERARDNKLEALIAADKRVAHGRVVKVIDLVRAEGVTKFAISVLKKEG